MQKRLSKEQLIVLLLAAGALFYAVCTVMQNNTWGSRERMIDAFLEVNPGHDRATGEQLLLKAQKNGARATLEMIRESGSVPGEGDYVSFALGLIHYYAKQYKEASSFLEKVKGPSRILSEAQMFRGLIAGIRGNRNEKEELLKQALTEYPLNVECLYHLSVHFFQNGELEKAADGMRGYLMFRPLDRRAIIVFAHILVQQARAYSKAADEAKAKTAYLDAVIELQKIDISDSQDLNLLLFYSDILKDGEIPHEAISFFSKLYERLDDFDEKGQLVLLQKYAFFCQKHMLYNKARELFSEINTRSEGKNADHLYWLGMIHYLNRHFNESEIFLKKALDMYRQSGVGKGELIILNTLALIDFRIGDYESAEKKYQELTERDQNFWQAYAGLADVSIRLEKFDQAEKNIEILKKHVPEYNYTLLRLQGNLNKAEKMHDRLTGN